MTLVQKVFTIIIVAIGTMITRFLPFTIFKSDKSTPDYVKFLGKVLPGAALGMLVIYSFKDVSIFSSSHGIPEIIAGIVVIALHLWKRRMFLSITGGTVLYMFLVQCVFQ